MVIVLLYYYLSRKTRKFNSYYIKEEDPGAMYFSNTRLLRFQCYFNIFFHCNPDLYETNFGSVFSNT